MCPGSCLETILAADEVVTKNEALLPEEVCGSKGAYMGQDISASGQGRVQG